jgi:hypothetical protein
VNKEYRCDILFDHPGSGSGPNCSSGNLDAFYVVVLGLQRDSTNITDSNRSAIIGQGINLKVVTGDVTPDSYLWTIAGNTFASYTPTTSGVTRLVSTDINKATIHYYWSNGTTSDQVDCKVAFGTSSFDPLEHLNVTVPTADVSFSNNSPSVGNSAAVKATAHTVYGYSLHCGDYGTDGMACSYSNVQNIGSFSGDWEFCKREILRGLLVLGIPLSQRTAVRLMPPCRGILTPIVLAWTWNRIRDMRMPPTRFTTGLCSSLV